MAATRRAMTSGLCILVAVCSAPLACRDRSAGTPASHVVVADAAPAGDAGVVAAASADAVAAADAGPAETIAWDQYFSLRQRPDDVLHAYEETYAAMPTTPLASLDDAVVLCRVAVVEPAPLPASAWDRANGRDLQLEITAGNAPAIRSEGPLGEPAFFVRVDDALRRAISGDRVEWTLRDRDQQHAYPYANGIVLGSFVVPRDVKVPLHVKPPHVDMECRGAGAADASRALLDGADKALADAERETTSGKDDLRSESELRSELSHAADRIRIGEVIALSMMRRKEWSVREERLKAIVRRYLASARDAYAKIAPVAVGSWARVGPSVSARIGAWVCPPIPKGADPGPLNDEQRTGCGLTLELKSAAKLQFDANPWGPAYACRMTGPIALAVLDGPGNVEGVCVLGVRRGKQWLKASVELGPTEPTVLVIAGGQGRGDVMRISIGEASALLATPPPP